MTAALILAAGSSVRMGQPKALLEYRGKTFLENIISILRGTAIDDIVVAISPSDDKITQSIALDIATIVYNRDHANAGPLGSIKAGINYLINHSVESVLVWPVDQPHVTSETVQALIAAFARHRPAIAIALPVFAGQRGHPVVFGREVFQELLLAPPDQGARSVVRRDPARVLEVPVPDAAVTQDIDTPEDYERLISSTKSLL